MEKQKNIPQLRFPEFKGDWENKTLGTLSDVRDGTHNHQICRKVITCYFKNLIPMSMDLSDITLLFKGLWRNNNVQEFINDVLFGMIEQLVILYKLKKKDLQLKMLL